MDRDRNGTNSLVHPQATLSSATSGLPWALYGAAFETMKIDDRGRLMTSGTASHRTHLVPLNSFSALTVAAAFAAVGGLGTTWALGSALAAPAGASSKVTVVKATETDFHIALSKTTWKPGKYKFVAKNKGVTTHTIQITGPGLGNARAQDISSGQSTTLTVTLKKGNYDLFCPIPGHKALGMNVNITVRGSGGSSGSG
jgi:uncharacterized cupredoxin-like copper-binding protein